MRLEPKFYVHIPMKKIEDTVMLLNRQGFTVIDSIPINQRIVLVVRRTLKIIL